MVQPVKVVLTVRFFRTATDNEPVRDWLKELEPQDRKTIGEDVKTVQIGWPLGMPLVRKMGKEMWEVRIHLHRRIARVLFTVRRQRHGPSARLHQEVAGTPKDDLALAKDRLSQIRKA